MTFDVFDSYAEKSQWPGVIIDSTQFNQESGAERFFALAMAYLNASSAACRNIGEIRQRQTWPDACVAYYCLYHATELFLKACILFCSPHEKFNSHDVCALRMRYGQLTAYVDHDFDCPWTISAADINFLVGETVIQGVDRVPDQKYRYGAGKDMRAPKSSSCLRPGSMLCYTRYLSDRWTQIWKHVKSQRKG